MDRRYFERQEREARERSLRTGETHETALQAIREGKPEPDPEEGQCHTA